MMVRAAALILAGVLLASCTTSSTLRLGSDRAMITTRGNAFTAPEMVIRDAMLQAAHQAQAGGYEWFVVDSTQDQTQHTGIFTPASGSAQASGNAFGWQGTGSYTGASYIPLTKPGASFMVRFGNGPRPAGAFGAAEIIALNEKKK